MNNWFYENYIVNGTNGLFNTLFLSISEIAYKGRIINWRGGSMIIFKIFLSVLIYLILVRMHA